MCMCIEDMFFIVEKLDKVGFWLVEFWGGVIFDVCICYLGEDFWECIRKLKVVMFNMK